MTCSCNYLLFFVWLLIVKTDKYLLVLWSCNYYSLNTIVSWLVNWKIIEFYITETTINRKNCNHFPKSRCIPELSWNFLKSQMPRSCFFSLWISRCVSSEQPFLNTTGLHDDSFSDTGFPGGSDSKESACNAGVPGSFPELGRCPGEENGNLFQYSCLENSMDREDWWARVHGS